MIYLSRLDLNPRSRQVRAELADPYQMHRTLSKAFGDDPGDFAQARPLFRVDESTEGSWVLVQSRVMPAWKGLSARDSYLAALPRVKEWEPAFVAGQRLAFRLRANPTVKRDGKRYALLREEDQLRWLDRKGEAGGFQVTNVAARPDAWLKCQMARGHAELAAVRYDGFLQVVDPDRFRSTVETGVGSAKGFGFGLLSLARARG